MPIYEYHCETCDRTYEELQGTKAGKTIRCEGCGGLAARVVSSFLLGDRKLSKDDFHQGEKDPAKRMRRFAEESIRQMISATPKLK